jgi:sugar lactone lactonase YvrE
MCCNKNEYYWIHKQDASAPRPLPAGLPANEGIIRTTQGLALKKVRSLFAMMMLLAVSTAPAQASYEPYAITTLAGSAGAIGSANGTGSAARFYDPVGVALDSSGNAYVADSNNQTIRKITSSGVVTTLAGLAGTPGSVNGTGSAARFSTPIGVAVDSAGNLYVADYYNQTIRKITSGGVVTTLAGLTGTPGSTDGTGSAARFNYPIGVAVDNAGNVYVADLNNQTIRKITSGGVVSTLAGLAGASGSADGTGSAARFNYPRGVAVDSASNVYVADSNNQTIRKITSGGVVTTLAGLAGASGSADGTGSVARFNNPFGVAVDSASNVYVADPNNQTIRKVTSGGVVKTLAGFAGATGNANGTASAARFNYPFGVAVDSAGNLYVGDTSNHTIRTGALAPPLITSPLTVSATVGQQFIYQFGTTGATSRSVTNLPAGLTFNTNLAAITGTPTAAGTFQVGLSATNAAGTSTATLTITVQPAPSSGPVIVTSTSATGRVEEPFSTKATGRVEEAFSTTGRVGQAFSFQVATTGGSPSARINANGLPPGLSIDAVTGLISGTPTAEGSFAVTLTVTDGNQTTVFILELTFTADPAIPVIISSNSAALTAGQAFSYSIDAPSNAEDASDPTVYTLMGTLPNGLIFDAQTGKISGTFGGNFQQKATSPDRIDLSGGIISNVQLFATNSHGTSTIQLLFTLAPKGAVNISTRIAVGTDEKVLIGGFIITGNAPKQVILRAIGPSLRINGAPIPGALQDPTLELHSGDTILNFNDNWTDFQEDEIKATGVPPTDLRESAMIATLHVGNYTAILRGKDNTTGIAVVELYDLGTAGLDSSSKAQLAQISTRGTVLNNDNVMIGGFIISGVATKVIVRAIGPELNNTVPGALQDTLLELHDGSGSLIFANDDWRTTQEQEIIDTTVPPTDDHESAIVATLNPGNYTAIVRGKNGTTGVALVEVYGLQ